MGWMQFVSDMTGRLLSWPVAVAAIVIVLRKSFGRLIERIVHAKGPGWEIDLTEQLEESREDVEQATEDLDGAPPASTTEQAEEGLSATAQDAAVAVSQAGAIGTIIESWNWLEGGLLDVIQPGTDSRRGAQALTRALGDRVTPETLSALRRLRHIRNEVTHGLARPTPLQAADFRLQCYQLRLAILRQLAPGADRFVPGNS